jgi:hypothetical protein
MLGCDPGETTPSIWSCYMLPGSPGFCSQGCSTLTARLD